MLTHLTSTGQLATRKTAHAYSHVIVGRLISRPEGDVEVISWHKTEAAALRQAARYDDPRAVLAVEVEAVNGGTRA